MGDFEGLPLIPGFKFHDPTVQEYQIPQKLVFSNGYPFIRDSDVGIGRRRLLHSAQISSNNSEFIDTTEYDPSWTYGRVREYEYDRFLPRYVYFAQKCLSFKGFFRQTVFNSPDEQFRVRHVKLLYFLEDDTLTIIEPGVNDAGFQQGKLVRRGKIYRDSYGTDFLHWKDLNVGQNISIYGVIYRITDCDAFTREYLTSQGVDVGEREETPQDPYLAKRRSTRPKSSPSISSNPGLSAQDLAGRKFFEFDGMVLTFQATWNNKPYNIMYFLADDTVAIQEQRQEDRKESGKLLLKRTRVPKNWEQLSSSYPAVYMELPDHQVTEYYTPKDFQVGKSVRIFSRDFLIHDCNEFTRRYYSRMLQMDQEKLEGNLAEPADGSGDKERTVKFVPPPHIPFGSPEDTLASCLSIVPKAPKKRLEFPTKLRYSLRMLAVHPEDEGRDFILEYSTSDNKILIHEIWKRNSGRLAGPFLASTRVPKVPARNGTDPEYYKPEDFLIGGEIRIFGHWFKITGADLFVYHHMQENPDKFSEPLRDHFKRHFLKMGLLQESIDHTAMMILEDNGIGASDEGDDNPREENGDVAAAST